MMGTYEVICGNTDPDWLKYRRTGIGASEIAIPLGVNRWGSEIRLYAEKIGEIEPDDKESERMEWGRRLEPVIITAFAERTGLQITPCGLLIRSKEHPWAGATLDAVLKPQPNEPDIPVEVKNSSSYNAEEWSEGPPDHYMAQIQHQMLVTGAPFAYIVCLLGGNKMVWAKVDRDETWINRIIYHGERFWKLVVDRTPPAPDGSEDSRKALARLYPVDTGEAIELSAEHLGVALGLASLKVQKKEIESRIMEIENQIKAALGNATLGVLPDGSSFSWKLIPKKGYTVEASESRVLRFHKPKGDQ